MGRPECLQRLRLQDLQVRAGQCEYDFEQRHPQHRRGGEGHPLGRPGYEDNGPTAEQVFSVAAAADGTIFCAATGWGIACYDKALGRLSALNVPQFNSSEIRAVYYGGQNTLLLHTVQEELVRIRYGLSATGSMEVREKVGLFPEGGVKSVFDSRTALYLVTADV